jgi:hypothetical protein
MLTTFNPGLRRNDVVLNSFNSCISNTPKKFSWTPEMPFPKMVSQPRMLSKKFKSRVALKQLKSLADTHSRRDFNKQVDMVDSNMQFINFKTVSESNLSYEKLTILPNNSKLERVFCIFRFPDKMECILPKAVAKTFQIHFLTPQTFIRNKVLTMFDFNLIQEGNFNPSFINNSEEINLMEVNNSPPLLKIKGIRVV